MTQQYTPDMLPVGSFWMPPEPVEPEEPDNPDDSDLTDPADEPVDEADGCLVSGVFVDGDSTPYLGKVFVMPAGDIVRDAVIVTNEPLVFRLRSTNGAFEHSFVPGAYTVVAGMDTYLMTVPESEAADLVDILERQ